MEELNGGTKWRNLMDLCNTNNVILQTTRVKCAIHKEIHHLLNKESILGEHSGRASL